MISNLVDYLKSSRMKGEKFKKPQYKSLKEEPEALVPTTKHLEHLELLNFLNF